MPCPSDDDPAAAKTSSPRPWTRRWRPWTAALAAGALLLATLGACSPFPRRADVQAVTWSDRQRHAIVRGPRGQSSSGLQAASATLRAEGRPSAVEHHLRVLAAGGETELYRGNSARLLVDGPQTYAAMLAAIESARRRVFVESYIFDEEGMGTRLGDALARAVTRGAQAHVIVDAIGSFGTDTAFFDTLRSRGVHVCVFNPVNPLQRLGAWGLSHRDHRKVVVVDERDAFTGGLNISKVYGSGSRPLRRSRAASTADERGWRDTHVHLRGPVVEAFAESFRSTWADQHCEGPAPPAASATAAPAAGERVVKVIATDPSEPVNRLYVALLDAIDAAQTSLHLTMAYFAPGAEMVEALSQAARRGVKVQLILPSVSDAGLVREAGRSYYGELMAAGVEIFELQDALLHSKTLVIDGVFSTVGSTNLDWRSFVANNEINAIVLGEDFGGEMEALFQRDLAASQRITPEAWAGRGLWPRIQQSVGRLLEPLL